MLIYKFNEHFSPFSRSRKLDMSCTDIPPEVVDFPKYHKILTRTRGSVDPSAPACWSEKLHGANFRLHGTADGKLLRGSRNRTLTPGYDKFYGMMEAEWLAKTHNWYCALRAELGDGVEFCIYGEAFGKNVQKEIMYHPEIHFCAFDMIVDDVYIDVHRFEELCQKCNIPYVPIHYGTWEECMSVPIEGVTSPIAISLSGHELPPTNVWEGIVVKEVCESSRKRNVVKRKTRQFSEVDFGPTKIKNRGTPKPGANTAIVDEVMPYITRNRLLNVISHGEDTSNQMRLAGLLATDALEEYLLTEEKELSTAVKKKTKSALTAVARKVVAEWAK